MPNDTDRREIGRRVAEMRRDRRQVLGTAQIREELAALDERVLGRRRLASEERQHRRLERELADATSETEENFK